MAIRFDASGDVASRTTSMPSASAFTLMGWFKVSTNRGATGQMFFDLSGSPDFQVYHQDLVMQLWNGGSMSGSTLVAGTWYHIALTGNGTAMIAYLNGVVDINNTSYTPNTRGTFRIANSGFSEWLNGCAAAVKVFDAVLTADEIKQEMMQYKPVRTANLNSFYPLLHTGEDEIDFSGNGRTLTIGGTLATEDGPPIPWSRQQTRVFLPASGGGGSGVTATLDTTLGAFTLSSAGTVAVSGSATPTLGAYSLSSGGAVQVSGSSSPTLGAFSLSSAVSVSVVGSSTATLGAYSLACAGAASVSGSASPTLGALSCSSVGAVTVTGAATPTLGAYTLASDGTVSSPGSITATLGATLGAYSLSASVSVSVAAQSSPTLSAFALGSAVVVTVTGDLSATLGGFSLSASGSVSDPDATPAPVVIFPTFTAIDRSESFTGIEPSERATFIERSETLTAIR